MGSYHDIYDAHIEKIRYNEYPSLLKTAYLDHAGTTLYAKSLIDAYHQDLTSNLYGNPHSESPASWLATERVEDARLAVLEYFNADPDQFDVVFTANATAAIKIVADCFRDQGFWYGYHKDAHNSIVGVREVASASRCFASNTEVEQWIQHRSPSSQLQVFAYPAQSNMTGYRLPYSWSRQARTYHGETQQIYVLLDAASYLTSGRLDLSDYDAAPDFIALSFYKIFGYPDLGALLVRKSAFQVLTHRRYFGGGTVEAVKVIGGEFHSRKRQNIHDFLEDGTLPFHNIVALKHAITVHHQLFGTAKNISRHTANLSGWLYKELTALVHANGKPVVELYKDENAEYGDPLTQGPIMAFNILRGDSTYVRKSEVEKLAIDCGFQLRTGGVCNPGGIASMLRLQPWELGRNFAEGIRCGDHKDVFGGKPTGIIRVSLGPMSTKSDAMRFAEFVETFFVEASISSTEPIAQKTSITPIEGCLASPINGADYAAYATWDRRWCVVETVSGRPSTGLEGLGAKIDVATEELVMSHSGETFALSLWDFPAGAGTPNTAKDKNFNLYSDEALKVWLSRKLGIDCTLARYRGEAARKATGATTCVVANCVTSRYATRDELRVHYKDHARQFLEGHSFERQQRQAALVTWKDALSRWNRSTLNVSRRKQLSNAKASKDTRPSTSWPAPTTTFKSGVTVHSIPVVTEKVPDLGRKSKLASMGRVFGKA